MTHPVQKLANELLNLSSNDATVEALEPNSLAVLLVLEACDQILQDRIILYYIEEDPECIQLKAIDPQQNEGNPRFEVRFKDLVKFLS